MLKQSEFQLATDSVTVSVTPSTIPVAITAAPSVPVTLASFPWGWVVVPVALLAAVGWVTIRRRRSDRHQFLGSAPCEAVLGTLKNRLPCANTGARGDRQPLSLNSPVYVLGKRKKMKPGAVWFQSC